MESEDGYTIRHLSIACSLINMKQIPNASRNKVSSNEWHACNQLQEMNGKIIFSKDVFAPAVPDLKDLIRNITWTGTPNEILIVFVVYVHLGSDSIYAMVVIGRIPLSWALGRL